MQDVTFNPHQETLYPVDVTLTILYTVVDFIMDPVFVSGVILLKE